MAEAVLDAAAKAAADTKAAADKATADKATADVAAAKQATDDAAAAAAAKTMKTPEAQAAALKAQTDAAAAARKVPDKYALTVPDGGRIDPEDLARIEQTARAAQWTNEEAQAVIEQLHTDLDTQAAAFLAATQADKDYGGAKLAESKARAKFALDTLRPVGHPRRDAFLRLLNKSGAGNHVEVVALLADLGTLMREDTPIRGSVSGGTPDTREAKDVLYPKKTA